MIPPAMAGWNLALRFGLEVGAIAGLAAWTWRSTAGPTRWAATVAVPLGAIVVWTVFNVPDDPSRSGGAPVVVAGWLRLAIELGVLGAGAVALALRGPQWVGAVFAALVVVHYAESIPRVAWLLHR